VQAFPSLQADPSAFAGFEQVPVAVSQTPATWHWSKAPHVTGFNPVHTPPSHASVCVHAFPSLQLVPSAFAGFEQAPVAASQTPAMWH
jgi:hypothetical protein